VSLDPPNRVEGETAAGSDDQSGNEGGSQSDIFATVSKASAALIREAVALNTSSGG
jgi:hypothetical protein